MRYTGFFPSYLFPIPCSLLPTPYSLFPVPCSLLPTPYSLLPTPCSLKLIIPSRPIAPCFQPTVVIIFWFRWQGIQHATD
ncbi:MAG: hypothetical protein F6K56_29995 [Moorea sp. SIO3G5]|nr:hypothetical protein [Moorena sp. SIO3G5]